MKREGCILSFFWSFLAVLIFGRCTADEIAVESPREKDSEIPLSIQIGQPQTRVPGDTLFSVNRLLLLPFRQSNPGAGEAPSNYVPLYDKVKQVDASFFPVTTQTLALPSADRYQLLVIGYNRTDYDFTYPTNAFRRFSIGSTSSSPTLDNVYLQPVDPTDVPEFFVCIAEGYKNTTYIGPRFSPPQINHMTGTLKRIVGGFTLQISGIPSSVGSISLTAEQLVTAIRASDGTPLTWQTPGDSGKKLFGNQAPSSGRVTFNTYLLATPGDRKTLFYLDVATGASTERFTMKVTDTPEVASANRIIFSPNHWVNITGNYTDIKPGFFISGSINLDDNAWDGLQ